MNTVSSKKKKEWKDHQMGNHEQILHVCQKKKRFATPSVDASFVNTSITENFLSNYVTPPTSTSTISVDCSKQESIPIASTPINQKPIPKQDKLKVAIGVEKDVLLLLRKKTELLSQ